MGKRLQGFIFGILVGAFIAGGVAYAVTVVPPNGTDRYYACVSTGGVVRYGTMRMNVTPAKCPNAADTIRSWNAEGPPGSLSCADEQRIFAAAPGFAIRVECAPTTTTLPPLPTAPSAPQDFFARWGTAFDSVFLSWQSPASDGGESVTDFRLETSTDNGATWSPLVTDPNRSAVDTGCLYPGSVCAYRVAAINAVGTGSFADIGAAVEIPTTPTGFARTLSCAGSTRTVNLSWNSSIGPVWGYHVYRSTDGVTWTLISSAGGTSLTTTTSKTLNSVRYYLTASAGGWESSASPTITLAKYQCT